MKICAIINFWDGEEILHHCIDNWRKCVDMVIVIYSNQSNSIERKDNDRLAVNSDNVHWVKKEPLLHNSPMLNERMKRNFGLEIAKQFGFELFVMSDCDEFYDPEEFKNELKKFEDNPRLQGLVCASQVYFKSPTLTIGLDKTRVTFIHRITPRLEFTFNRNYPFAFDGMDIFIDPTRQLNINSGVEWSPIIMHHYSWVRKDYEEKIKNSSAYINLQRSSIRQDLLLAKPEYFVKFYGKELVRVPNLFSIPEMNDIQSH